MCFGGPREKEPGYCVVDGHLQGHDLGEHDGLVGLRIDRMTNERPRIVQTSEPRT